MAGIQCAVQELLTWKQENLDDGKYIDAISVLRNTPNKLCTKIQENPSFILEQDIARGIYAFYSDE